MGRVCLIAAVGKSGQIGLNGDLPWGRTMKDDLRWFREQTTGGILIAGSTTAHSMPYPLGKGRSVYVWRRYYRPADQIKFLREAFPERDIFIVGGTQTYRAFLPFVERFLINRVDYDGPADTWFPFEALVDRQRLPA